jgi:nucleoside-diphosphate-sugar epimerase
MPCETYGLSKALGEQVAEMFARSSPETSFVSLRFTNIVKRERWGVSVNPSRSSSDEGAHQLLPCFQELPGKAPNARWAEIIHSAGTFAEAEYYFAFPSSPVTLLMLAYTHEDDVLDVHVSAMNAKDIKGEIAETWTGHGLSDNCLVLQATKPS